MPNLENELTKLGGTTCFAIFDLSHGYWQLELDGASQHLQSFITPDGIFSPTRVLPGTTNAVTYLQLTLAHHLPSDLFDSFLFWLGDVLIYACTAEELLKSIRHFF